MQREKRNVTFSSRIPVSNLQMLENRNHVGGKPNLNASIRKPFTDRAVNSSFQIQKCTNRETSSLIPKQVKKDLSSNIQIHNEDYPPWYFDVFSYSYQEPADMCNDILPDPLCLDDYKYVTSNNRPNTPPPKVMSIEEMQCLPVENVNIFEKPDFDFDDVGIPEFDFEY